MAQLLVATAGAAVGSLFGPIGVSVGWALGSVVGGMLFAPKQVQETRVADNLSVSVASYGAPLPIRYGTWKGGGVIFWHSPEFRPIRNETSSGGKGGPKVSTVSYTYEIDVAVAVNDGEIGGVSRIWLDGVPVFDQRDSAELATLIASQAWCEAVTVYLGDETQLADPTMESALGAGNVPAYRGTAYVVVRGLKCGNSPRLPNLEFEVCTGLADPPTQLLSIGLPSDGVVEAGTPYNTQARVIRVQGDLLYKNFGDGRYAIRYPISALIDGATDPVLPDSSGEENWPSGGPLFDPTFMSGSPDRGLVKNSSLLQYSPDGVVLYFRGQLQSVGATGVYPSLRQGIGTAAGYTIYGDDYTTTDIEWISRIAYGQSPSPSALPGGAAGCADRNYFMTLYSGVGWALWRIDSAGEFTQVRFGTFSGGTPTLAYGVSGSFWDGTGAESIRRAACVESDLEHYWVAYGSRIVDGGPADGVRVECWEIGADDVMSKIVDEVYELDNQLVYQAAYADNGILWVNSSRGIDSSTDQLIAVTRLPLYTVGGVGLDTVVQDLYLRTGNGAGDIDVTDLATKTVRGFEFSGPRPARQAIEMLRSGFFFDGVESDAQIVFRLRGGSVAADVAADDLAPMEETGRALVPAERQHEAEIPAQVMVDYVSHDGDYRRGSQQAQRATTGSEEVLALELPIKFSDDEAAQIADTLLRSRWRERNTRRFSVSRGWAALEPTDVIDVSDAQFTYRLRIVADRRAGGLITFDAVDEGGASYSSGASGGAVDPPAGLTQASSAKLAVLDVPPLRNADDGGYHYLAAAPYSGATLSVDVFRSLDGGESWVDVAPLTEAAAIGVALGALGAGRSDVVDETSTVRVQMVGAGTLASVTYDEMLAGAQYAALGAPGRWEILGFASVDDEGGGIYGLSRLVRGRLGTEDAMASHAIGDVFVLLDSSVLARIGVEAAQRDRAAQFAAVPAGLALENAPRLSLVQELRSLKPLSPAHFQGVRTDAGDTVFRWARRARIEADWRDLIDVPLDEDEELYDLEILRASDDTVLRTVTTADREVTYTAAQRAADVGSGTWALAARVYQRSALVGRGVPAELASAGSTQYARNWDNSDYSQQTLYNSGSQTVTSGEYKLTCSDGTYFLTFSRQDWIPAFANGAIEIDFPTPWSGTGRGIVFRQTYWATGMVRSSAAYMLELLTSGTVLSLSRGNNASGGSQTNIGSAVVDSTAPRRMRVEFTGSRLRVYWNGAEVMDFTDSTYSAAGYIGLFGAGNGTTFTFDNLSIEVN